MLQRLRTISYKEESVKQSLNGKQIEEKDLTCIREEFIEQIKDKVCGIDFENEAERTKFQEKIERKIK